jgi:hypothetical protein
MSGEIPLLTISDDPADLLKIRFRSQSEFDCIHGFDKSDPARALASPLTGRTLTLDRFSF